MSAELWTIVTHIVILITAILCTILIITHLYRFCKNEISSPASKSKQNIALYREISILTIIMVVSMGSVPISGLFQRIVWYFNTPPCEPYAFSIFNVLYYTGKGSMYLIFIMRLHSVYEKSIYKFAVWKLKLFAIFETSIIIALAVLGVATTKIYAEETTLFGKEITNCDAQFIFINIVLVGLNELFVIFITLVAFLVPLRKMMRSLQQYPNAEQSTLEFKYIAIKTTALTLTASLTTFLSLIITALLNRGFIFNIDQTLNILCIILMTPYYKSLYDTLCCGIHQSVIYISTSRSTNNDVGDDVSPQSSQVSPKPITREMEDTLCETRTIAETIEPIKYEPQSIETQI